MYPCGYGMIYCHTHNIYINSKAGYTVYVGLSVG